MFTISLNLSPDQLRNSKKGVINIKNNDNKCFLLCHIRHSNPLKIHSERITKADRRMVNDLNYQRITVELKRKTIFALMYFVMKLI